MKVERLSFQALKKILNGSIRETATCVIKFYSNDCHYCHALKEYYEDLANTYEDIYFFAFNTGDTSAVDRLIKISGVPTIALVRSHAGGTPIIRILEEPIKPNDHTWYRSSDIKNFIERHKK